MEPRQLAGKLSPIAAKLNELLEPMMCTTLVLPPRACVSLALPDESEFTDELMGELLSIVESFDLRRDPLCVTVNRMVHVNPDGSLRYGSWTIDVLTNREGMAADSRAEQQLNQLLACLENFLDDDDAEDDEDGEDDQKAPGAEDARQSSSGERIPATLAEAVTTLRQILPRTTVELIRDCPESGLYGLHHSVGQAIRNGWLYPEGSPLMEAARREMGSRAQPDDISHEILCMLRKELQKG